MTNNPEAQRTPVITCGLSANLRSGRRRRGTKNYVPNLVALSVDGTVVQTIYDFARGLSEQSSQFDKDLFCQAILDEFRNLQANYNHDYPPQPLTKAGT